MFHQITGLYCPGCGVSRMCLALFRLDFVSAFRANAAIFLLLPAGLAIAIQTAVRYVKTGNGRLTRVSDLDPGRHDRHSAPVRHPAQSARFYLDAANAIKPTADSYCSHHAKSGVLQTITRFAMHRNCIKRSFAPCNSGFSCRKRTKTPRGT